MAMEFILQTNTDKTKIGFDGLHGTAHGILYWNGVPATGKEEYIRKAHAKGIWKLIREEKVQVWQQKAIEKQAANDYYQKLQEQNAKNSKLE